MMVALDSGMKLKRLDGNVPYVANPLFIHGGDPNGIIDRDHIDNNNSKNFKWSVLDKIVTPLPYSHTDLDAIPDCTGEIEVSMEECLSISPNPQHSKPMFRRIAVRSYGNIIGKSQLLHASFSIPISELPPCQNRTSSNNWLCWTRINDEMLRKQKMTKIDQSDYLECTPGKLYLCALTGPSTLRIFDVYPNITGNKSFEGGGGAGEGHTITLDFIASSIFALPIDQGGIMIQRAMNDYEFSRLVQSDRNNENIIQGPPSTIRVGSLPNTNEKFSSLSKEFRPPRIDTSLTMEIGTKSEISSLFTLQHPLDEIRPCALLSSENVGSFPSLFSDAKEQIVFIGKPRCFTNQADSIANNLIVVTYNIETQYHCIWVLDRAPVSKPSMPLWKSTSNKIPQQNQERMGTTHDQAIDSNDPSACFVIKRLHHLNHFQGRSKTIFLSTSYDGTGDFVLCMMNVQSALRKDMRLCCYVLNPPTDIGKSWSIKDDYTIPCISAQPIQCHKMPPAPFCTAEHFKKPLDRSSLRYIDLIVCQDTNKPKLSLYRGRYHSLDFSIPQNLEIDHLFPKFLCNAIGDRIDVVFADKNENIDMVVRLSFSVDIKNSALTEMAMDAIGSSLIYSDASKGNFRDGFIALQSDHCILSQILSSKACKHAVSDEVEWDAFELILFYLLSIASGGLYDSSASAHGFVSHTTDDNVWDCLLSSSFHDSYSYRKFGFLHHNPVKKQTNLSNDEIDFIKASRTSKWISSQSEGNKLLFGSLIFDSLHMLYEDFRCQRGFESRKCISKLASSLLFICKSSMTIEGKLLMEDFVRKYTSDDFASSSRDPNHHISCTIVKRLSLLLKPLCIFGQLESLISGENDNSVNQLNGTCKHSGLLLQFYHVLFSDSSNLPNDERRHKLVKLMTDSGFTDPELLAELYPIATVIPLLNALHWCKSNPPADGNQSCYNLISRNDLAKTGIICRQNRPNWNKDISQSFPLTDDDNDGLVPIEAYSSIMFPYDLRVKEAARLLRSSRPVFLRVQRAVEVSDHEYERMKQQKLAMLCRRLLPLPVGRGMLTFGTLDCLPVEPITFPKLCLAGRVPPHDTIVALDEARCTSKHKMWPEFHNGVAAGLRLPHADSENVKRLSRTWIVCNNPKHHVSIGAANQTDSSPDEDDNDHAFGGFLMALGLRGHLASLTSTDILDYLNSGSITTTVGIMLGLAAGKRGTSDVVVRKTLCVHIPSLFPTSFRSIDLAASVQTVAVMGVGLLFQKSSDRLLSEFLLNEIGRRITADQSISDREGYILCCGFSLGLVNLCLRGQTQDKHVLDGLSDLNIEERLMRYISGGIDESYSKQRRNDILRSSHTNVLENEKSTRVSEGEMINTGVTSPAAILALGLIYHRSENASIASLIALPSTNFALDDIRPDFLMIRTIARSLIMWNEIQPSNCWVEDQIPINVKNVYNALSERSKKISGIGALSSLSENDKNNSQTSESINDDILEVDHKSIRQSYIYIVAGSCFSLGLRYVGTGNAEATNVVCHYVNELQKLRDESDPASAILRPEKTTIEMCLGATAISLGLIMAGTGDLKVFRILKSLRQKFSMDIKFGNHMAYASAIGLLFLGGGTCSLGNEPEDIAALLISFYPRYPIFTHDNQYHLQALRHLYALAVKKRKLEIIDVDMNEEVIVPVRISYDENEIVHVTAPCLILNNGKSCKISIDSSDYYQVDISIDEISALNETTRIFVKKKSGRLSHVQDPHGNRALFSKLGGGNNAAIDYISSFIEENRVLAYVKYMCNASEVGGFSASRSSQDLSSVAPSLREFYGQAVKEALRIENVEAVYIFLALYQTMQEKHLSSTTNIWSLRILRTYLNKNPCLTLVNSHLVASIIEMVDRSMSQMKNTSTVPIWNGSYE